MELLRPRHYAERIAEIPDIEGRRKALEGVPEELRAFVQVHLVVMWNRKRLGLCKNVQNQG